MAGMSSATGGVQPNAAVQPGVAGTATIPKAELLKLCAVDTGFFGKHFFPEAMRDRSPDFDKEVWDALENPNHRLVSSIIFRGGAKTTKLRVFTAKRIAFGISRTILYVGASESHATRSVQWLRGKIEPKIGADGTARRSYFAETFDLRPGKKWQEHEIEVFHALDQRPIWILGVGITGNIRGINFDDYRPDLIILDDIVTDENAATLEQREKVATLVMGALKDSLVPRTEEPNAKMAMLQTPLDADDVSARAQSDPEWHTVRHGCWTKETEYLPIEQQVSSWPSRYPSADLRKQKQAAISANRLSIFSREMECKLIAAETAAFRPNWLSYYDERPKVYQAVLVIDPVPPPSDLQMAKALRTKDFEAQAVVGRSAGNYYLLDYRLKRGHDPSWSAATMFELGMRYRISRVVLETIAAQRYLKWFLEQEMVRKQCYFAIKDMPGDQRPKFVRITTALNGPASQGKFFIHRSHVDFIAQFQSYGVGYKGNDDLLDAVAGGVRELTNPYLELGAGEYAELPSDGIEEFSLTRACP